ncbi:MAG: FAD-dependent oxidoreductase [Alphaproteobacteria bacterium]|nr:FAD-dependent oxidoreductase [Alphaproteobacteria bacterium]
MSKIIVLGAGVVGVTSAYFLACAGNEVVVIDKNPDAAMDCSYANGGQLSYSHIETWAARNSLLAMVKAAILPGSFLSVSDFSNKKFWRFVAEFYKNSATEKSLQNSKNLFTLSSYSKEALQQILKEETKLKFDYKKEGILHFYRTQKSFEQATKNAEFSNLLGCETQILNAEECVRKESALVKLFDEKKLVGGIFYPQDASGNSAAFTRSLAQICQKKFGVVFEYNTNVKNILTNYKKITGINSDRGVFTANNYVYALGAGGLRLLSGINVETGIYPVKGHSLSISCDQEFVAPHLAMTDLENKVVYSRLGNVFRVAGTVEFRGSSSQKNPQQISFLKNIVSSSFSEFGNFNQVEEWHGFRPFRPNSLPLVCEVKKYGNLFLNTGHGSLGWTLAAGSGKVLSELVSGKGDQRFSFLEI